MENATIAKSIALAMRNEVTRLQRELEAALAGPAVPGRNGGPEYRPREASLTRQLAIAGAWERALRKVVEGETPDYRSGPLDIDMARTLHVEGKTFRKYGWTEGNLYDAALAAVSAASRSESPDSEAHNRFLQPFMLEAA